MCYITYQLISKLRKKFAIFVYEQLRFNYMKNVKDENKNEILRQKIWELLKPKMLSCSESCIQDIEIEFVLDKVDYLVEVEIRHRHEYTVTRRENWGLMQEEEGDSIDYYECESVYVWPGEEPMDENLNDQMKDYMNEFIVNM